MSTEKETQKAILNYLTLKRIFSWRNNTGAFKTEKGSFVRFGALGSPDVFALVAGTLYGIEVKSLTGRLSEAQEAYQEAFTKAGGIYILARTLDNVTTIL